MSYDLRIYVAGLGKVYETNYTSNAKPLFDEWFDFGGTETLSNPHWSYWINGQTLHDARPYLLAAKARIEAASFGRLFSTAWGSADEPWGDGLSAAAWVLTWIHRAFDEGYIDPRNTTIYVDW